MSSDWQVSSEKTTVLQVVHELVASLREDVEGLGFKLEAHHVVEYVDDDLPVHGRARGAVQKGCGGSLNVAQVEPTCTQRPVGEGEAGKRAALEARCSRLVAGV